MTEVPVEHEVLRHRTLTPREHAPDGGTTPGVVAWLLAALLTAAGAAAVTMAGGRHLAVAALMAWVLVTGWTGAFIARRVWRNPLGWLLLGIATLVAIHSFAQQYADTRLAAGHADLTVDIAVWLTLWLAFPTFGLAVFVLLLFPSGRLPSPRWRWAARAAAAVTGLSALLLALQPGPVPSLDVPNPLGWDAAARAIPVALNLLPLPIAAVAVAAVVSLGRRIRRAAGEERQQLRWLRAAAVFLLLTLLFAGISPQVTNELSFVLALLGMTSVPVAIGVAVLRYRLYDLDAVINTALVYLLLSLAVTALYVAVVASVGTLFTRALGVATSLIATAVVAIAFQPARTRVQHLVARLLYGERRDPYALVTNLSRRLEDAVDPAAIPELVVTTLTGTVGLDYAAVELTQDGEAILVAERGTRPARPARLPLQYQGQTLGRLVYAAPRNVLGRRAERLLGDLARQTAPALHAVSLNTALQASRERLVLAREEERRRLRSDLHDSLGPQLAGLTLGLEAAGNLLAADPAAAGDVLAALRERSRDAVATVRSVVEGLRPPALDDLGLVGALQQRAEQLSTGLDIDVTAGTLPGLPAAVEVAAFHVASEAMTNGVRHAGAQRITVRLEHGEGDLRVRVSDDGRGLAPRVGPGGHGLTSIRERVDELGGELDIRSDAHGTVVEARLPLGPGR